VKTRSGEFGEVYVRMAENLLKHVHPERLVRFNVNFHIPEHTLDTLLGRAAHIQFLENQNLMKILAYCYREFFVGGE